MKYSYTSTLAVDTQGHYAKRPMIEVELIGKKWINGLALIDSGADCNMINIEYAEPLGILHGKEKEYTGIEGKQMKCFIANIPINVKHFDLPISIPFAFIDSPAVDILLGQEGFFDKFRIKFEKDHNVFEITYPPKKK
jgi:hypothetical protein